MALVASKMSTRLVRPRTAAYQYTFTVTTASTSDSTAGFPFLTLPAELRTLIYEAVFADGYKSIDKYMKKHVKRLAKAAKKQPLCSSYPPTSMPARFKTPSMLLVCRQIYQESQHILRNHPLEMHHGLLNLSLEKLISAPTFRKLTAIVIYDDGHNILDPKNYPSFAGHRELAIAISSWLRAYGHSDRELELHFESPDLKWHMDHCFHNYHTSCDMRRWVRAVTDAWMQVRGIPEVRIFGWLPQQMKDEMQRLMQSGHCHMARLPTGIVSRIMQYLVDFDSIRRAICRANITPTSRITNYRPELSTPAVFLVNRQFYDAVKKATRQQPLRLDFSFGPCQDETIRLTNFVGPKTLRSMDQIRLTIHHRSWLPVLFELGNILGQGHSLKFFSFCLEEQLPANFWQTASGLPRVYPDCRLADALAPLGLIRNVPMVHFSGDLDKPAALPFTERLMVKMSAPRHSILETMLTYTSALRSTLSQ